MWPLQSRLFTLIFFLIFAYFNEHSYANQETQESQIQSDEVLCGKEKVFSGNALHVWQEKTRSDRTLYATSDNSICLNNATNKLFIRKCNPITGEWSPPSSSVNCAIIQKPRNTFCPEDLIEIPVSGGSVCLKLSDNDRVFNESFCYGSDTLFGETSMRKAETQEILQYLYKQRGIKRFWLPVRRASYNKYFNPFVVRIPGYRWGDIYEIQDLYADKDCMTVEITSLQNQFNFRSQISDCSGMLPMVCIYRKDFVAYSGCPQGFGALAYKPNECYGIEWEAGLFPYDLRSLSIDEYISNRNALQLIFYSIDLKRNRFFLIGNFSDENQITYDIEMNSNEKVRILPFGGKRHALSCEHLTNLNRKSVEMILSENPQIGGLTLTIYNRNYIWRFSDQENFGVKCFTNSESDNMQWKTVKIKMIWQNTLETKALFKLKPGKYDGYYWCEAHTIFDFSIVKTNKIVVKQQKRGQTYALQLELPCPPTECYNLFSADTWKLQSKKAKKMLGDIKNGRKKQKRFEDLELNNIRLMDIAAIYNNETILQSLIHVSAYLKSSSIDQQSEQSSEEYDSAETDVGSVTTVRMKVLDLLTELIPPISSVQSKLVRNTLFCFPESFYMKSGEKNFWQLSEYGQTSTTMKLCLHRSGVPIIRQCQGEFLWGAFWEKFDYLDEKSSCSESEQSDLITYELRDIEAKKLTKKTPSKAVEKVRHLIEHNLENIIPADFYYISRIMHTTMKTILKDDNSNSSKHDVLSLEVARVYNYLMEVNEGVVKSSAMLNSTNVLLEAFERMVDEEASQIQVNGILLRNISETVPKNSINDLSKETDGINIVQYEDIGVEVKMASNFLIFIIDPYVANITGVALYLNFGETINQDDSGEETLQGCFKNNFYKFIMCDQPVDDLLYENNLELATYVPKTLWNRLDEISRLANFTTEYSNSTRFVIKIYANDILFQEQETEKESDSDIEKTVTSKIVSVSIPGHDKDLPEMLPLIFRTPTNNTDNNNTESSCSYWNYDTWANDGLTFIGRSDYDNSIILCGCTHLTPFAYLIGDGYKLSIDSDIVVLVKTHKKALDFITILGCSLSLFGTLGIFITAATFQSWRQKASSKVLLQLSGAISLQMVLFCFVNTEENSQHLLEYDVFSSCIAIGALLHYSVLVQFSWMIIIGYLQFKRYVQVFGNTRPKRFFKKSSIIGWGAPLIPVALVLIIDKESYIPDPNNISTQPICYPSGLALYFGVIFPVTVIIIVNFVIFSIIVYNILREPEGNLRHTEKGLALSQLRLSVLLFFLLGFTWIFGLLATLKAGIIFSYLFCLTATLQGFVIFIYFVILDPKTRKMWRGIFVNICGIKDNYESSISMKETIQTLR